MNISEPFLNTDILEKIKPLVILYLEEFSIRDIETKKPMLSDERMLELKAICFKEGLDEDGWEDLIREFASAKVSMKSRAYLREVKVSPDGLGNVYHKKERILEKIIQIITSAK